MSNLYVLGGPQAGKFFELREGANYIGRSSEHIQIEDPTVSRNHVKITVAKGRYYVTDLKSRNRTFCNGNYLAPGLEFELREGIPIAIGMTVLCVGEGCLEEMAFLDSIGLSRETGEQSGIYQANGEKTNQRILELLYKVSDVLAENLPVTETCKKILDHLFDVLKNIDRGIFILVDPGTGEITETISKPENIVGDIVMSYLKDIVRRVMAGGKPLVVSDAQTEKDDIVDTLKILQIQSVMCVPMSCKAETIGYLYVDSVERPYGFRSEDVALFMDLSQRIALAIQYMRMTTDQSPGAEDMAVAD